MWVIKGGLEVGRLWATPPLGRVWNTTPSGKGRETVPITCSNLLIAPLLVHLHCYPLAYTYEERALLCASTYLVKTKRLFIVLMHSSNVLVYLQKHIQHENFVMIVKTVFLFNFSIRCNLCLTLQKVDKGDVRKTCQHQAW